MSARTRLAVLASLAVILACGFPVSKLAPEQPGGSGPETLFRGVTYIRETRSQPRAIVVHVVQIDLEEKGILPLVTPGDPDREYPLDARTTSEFVRDFGVQIAINGDGFSPWRALGPLGYYPHSGDPVDVLGFAASEGVVYSQPLDQLPTLYLTRTNRAVFNRPPAKIFHAISGLEMVLISGRPAPGLDGSLEPRSAVGLNRSGKRLILMVVDGRQPGYSEGVTTAELADLMMEFGAHDAMNLDGGGSASLVVQTAAGGTKVLNSPIHQGVPGRERPVANHLGFYAKTE